MEIMNNFNFIIIFEGWQYITVFYFQDDTRFTSLQRLNKKSGKTGGGETKQEKVMVKSVRHVKEFNQKSNTKKDIKKNVYLRDVVVQVLFVIECGMLL